MAKPHNSSPLQALWSSVHVPMHVCMRVLVYAHMHVHVRMCACACVCMCMCMCVHVHVYVHVHMLRGFRTVPHRVKRQRI